MKKYRVDDIILILSWKKSKRRIKMAKYKVEKSKFPEDNKTHLVVRYSTSQYGINYQRVFKGTYKECVATAKKLRNNVSRETMKGGD